MNDKIVILCNLLKDNTKKDVITNYIKKLPGYYLSYFHYISIYCIKNNKGNIEVSKIFLEYIDRIFLNPFKGTITITFGDVAESHAGMQKIGNISENGFNLDDIQRAHNYFKKKGCDTFIIKLNDFLPNSIEDEEEDKYLKEAKNNVDFQAYILVIRNGMKYISNDTNGNNLLSELLFYEWDTKLYHEKKKKVLNKNARYNLNFDNISQKSDFESGKGTTVAFNQVPLLNNLRNKLVDIFGENALNLKCEGNKYYDSSKTGIGRHGDSERKKVIGVRLGNKMNMHWNWYYNDEPRGYDVSVYLNSGDIYCMSEKAVGTDWRPNLSNGWKKKRYTLRHCAGAAQYTTKTPKIEIRNQRKYVKNENIIIGDIFSKPKKSKKNSNPVWTNMSNLS